MRISDWSSDVCSACMIILTRAVFSRQRQKVTAVRWSVLWLMSIKTMMFPPPSSSATPRRSEEHTSEIQSLMRISYAVYCLKKQIVHTDPRDDPAFGRATDSITSHTADYK